MQQSVPAALGYIQAGRWEAQTGGYCHSTADRSPACLCVHACPTHREAANYVLQAMDPSRYQGVCFFDTDAKQWAICDTTGRCMPRHSSPVAERDTFAIFDEARCRGADLKLQQQAVGLLTLAPGMCKDKLMQAAGRMRQLGRGQTLQVVGLPDVTEKIVEANAASLGSSRKASELGMQHVLQWVMSNTVQANLHGVVWWAGQGLHFAASKGAPDRALVADDLLPMALYGSSKAPRPMADIVADMAQRQLRPQAGMHAAVAAAGESAVLPDVEPQAAAVAAGGSDPATAGVSAGGGGAAAGAHAFVQLRPKQQQLAHQIVINATTYGQGHKVMAGAGVDEECERELEREEEQEQEQQVQIARVDAAAEQDWNYTAALAAPTLSALATAIRSTCSIHRLQDVVQLLQPSSVASIAWSRNVFVTKNFMFATSAGTLSAAAAAGAAGCVCLNEYLRAVDKMLLFPAGELLLLSEREAEGVLELLWGAPSSSTSTTAPAASAVAAGHGHSCPKNQLLSLAYARLVYSAVQGTAARAAPQLPFLAHPLPGPGREALPFPAVPERPPVQWWGNV